MSLVGISYYETESESELLLLHLIVQLQKSKMISLPMRGSSTATSAATIQDKVNKIVKIIIVQKCSANYRNMY